ncbi:MAG: hypothetical protein QF471_07855 [Phycisphaerales bacterium]|nr:hypothetical protein [Phycisphaerales bacterium]
MVGTIGVVLIITLVLLLNIGQRTIRATYAVDLASSPEERESLEERLAFLSDRVAVDDLRNAVAKARMDQRAEIDHNIRREQRMSELMKAREAHFRTLHLSGNLQEAELLAVDAERLRTEIETQRRRRQISYLIDDDDSEAIVAELMSGRLVVSSVHASDVPQAIDSNDPKALAKLVVEQWIADSAERTTHLLLSLKPSGLAIWAEIDLLRREDPRLEGMAIGLDLIGEDATTTSMFDAVETPQ